MYKPVINIPHHPPIYDTERGWDVHEDNTNDITAEASKIRTSWSLNCSKINSQRGVALAGSSGSSVKGAWEGSREGHWIRSFCIHVLNRTSGYDSILYDSSMVSTDSHSPIISLIFIPSARVFFCNNVTSFWQNPEFFLNLMIRLAGARRDRRDATSRPTRASTQNLLLPVVVFGRVLLVALSRCRRHNRFWL